MFVCRVAWLLLAGFAGYDTTEVMGYIFSDSVLDVLIKRTVLLGIV